MVDTLLREIGAFIDAQQERSRNLISIALTMPGLVNPESGMVIYTPKYQIRNLALQIVAACEASEPEPEPPPVDSKTVVVKSNNISNDDLLAAFETVKELESGSKDTN